MSSAKLAIILVAMVCATILIDHSLQYINTDWGTFHPNKDTECVAFFHDSIYNMDCYLIKEK